MTSIIHFTSKFGILTSILSEFSFRLYENALSSLLKARRKNAKTELAPHVRLSIMTIKCFTKNATGYNSYFKTNDFNFKAEKEWRYVPTKSEIGGNLISQSKKLYDKKQDYYNDKLKDFPLRFTIMALKEILKANIY
jgi:hypothetical protein